MYSLILKALIQILNFTVRLFTPFLHKLRNQDTSWYLQKRPNKKVLL